MSSLKSEVLDPSKLQEADRAIWQRLCQNHLHLTSAFLTPTFVRAVAHVRTGVRIAVIRRDGTAVAFLPFQFKNRLSRFLRAAEPAGGSLTDYFGLIAEPGFKLSNGELLGLTGLQYLGFTHLPESQLGYGIEGKQPQKGLIINLDGGPEKYWRNLAYADKKFVEDTSRRRRRIEKIGPLRFEFHCGDSKGLDKLIDNKRAQYRRTRVKDCLAETWKRDLLQGLLKSDAPECSGVLSSLFAGDTWIASHFGLACHGVLHYWFPVYSPDLVKYSPGRMLLQEIINAATERKLTAIDRGVGDSQAKRDFANFSHQFYRGAWYRSSMTSLLYRAGCSLGWRLSAAAKS